MKEEEIKKAGDAWKRLLKKYPALEEAWSAIPEPTNTWFSQQIDIFAGKYPKSEPVKPVGNEKVMDFWIRKFQGRFLDEISFKEILTAMNEFASLPPVPVEGETKKNCEEMCGMAYCIEYGCMNGDGRAEPVKQEGETK